MIKTQKMNFNRFFPSLMTEKLSSNFIILMSLFKTLIEFFSQKKLYDKKNGTHFFIKGVRVSPEFCHFL
jgi:hypothetical protein